jgi:hypothetical protein
MATQEDVREVHYYLDGYATEYTAEEFSEAMEEPYGQNVYLLYVGGGYCPLTFAVLAYNESDAVSAMEEWCITHNRPEEIGLDDDETEPGYGEYELHIQTVKGW